MQKKQQPLHVVRGARVEGVFLLFDPEGVGKHVVSFSLLPEIVELHQLAHSASAHLLALDTVEVLAVDPEAGLECAAFLLRPERHRVGRRNGVHAFPAQGFFNVIAALEEEVQGLKSVVYKMV